MRVLEEVSHAAEMLNMALRMYLELVLVCAEVAGRSAGTFEARAWPAAASLQKRYQRTMRPNKHTATPLDIHSGAALAFPPPSHILYTASTHHRLVDKASCHRRRSSAPPPQWRARVGPPTSPHASPEATTARGAETRTRRRYGSLCWITFRVGSDCQKRVYSCWVRATIGRIGDTANAQPQAELQKHSESSSSRCPQTLQTTEDRQTEAGSRQLRTNSPWATRTRMCWIRITRVCSVAGCRTRIC